MLLNRSLQAVSASAAAAGNSDCRSAAGSPFSSPSRIPGISDEVRSFLSFITMVKRDPALTTPAGPEPADGAPASQAPKPSRTKAFVTKAEPESTTTETPRVTNRQLFPLSPPSRPTNHKTTPAKPVSSAGKAPPRTPVRQIRPGSVLVSGNLTPPSERGLMAPQSIASSPATMLSMTPFHGSTPLSSLDDDEDEPSDGSDTEDEPVDVTGLGEAVYACQFARCGFVGASRQEYRQHMQSHASGEQGRYYCDYEGCGKSFCRAYSLKYHQYTHYDNAPFVCTEPGCGKKFSHLSRLKRHGFSHHPDERSFPCQHPGCNKRFSQKCHLKIHLQTHSRKGSSSALGESSDGYISDV